MLLQRNWPTGYHSPFVRHRIRIPSFTHFYHLLTADRVINEITVPVGKSPQSMPGSPRVETFGLDASQEIHGIAVKACRYLRGRISLGLAIITITVSRVSNAAGSSRTIPVKPVYPPPFTFDRSSICRPSTLATATTTGPALDSHRPNEHRLVKIM